MQLAGSEGQSVAVPWPRLLGQGAGGAGSMGKMGKVSSWDSLPVVCPQ